MLTNGSELHEVALEKGNLVMMMLWSRRKWQSLMLGMVLRSFGQMSMRTFAVENDCSVDRSHCLDNCKRGPYSCP